MEENKEIRDSEPVPVDYVKDDETKKPDEPSPPTEEGKNQVDILVKTLAIQHE